VDERYRVMVTDSIEIEMPERIITQYHKEPLILPKDAARFPSQVALEWHRGKVFCG
jgi:predicted restriction endonuclease